MIEVQCWMPPHEGWTHPPSRVSPPENGTTIVQTHTATLAAARQIVAAEPIVIEDAPDRPRRLTDTSRIVSEMTMRMALVETTHANVDDPHRSPSIDMSRDQNHLLPSWSIHFLIR